MSIIEDLIGKQIDGKIIIGATEFCDRAGYKLELQDTKEMGISYEAAIRLTKEPAVSDEYLVLYKKNLADKLAAIQKINQSMAELESENGNPFIPLEKVRSKDTVYYNFPIIENGETIVDSKPGAFSLNPAGDIKYLQVEANQVLVRMKIDKKQIKNNELTPDKLRLIKRAMINRVYKVTGIQPGQTIYGAVGITFRIPGRPQQEDFILELADGHYELRCYLDGFAVAHSQTILNGKILNEVN